MEGINGYSPSLPEKEVSIVLEGRNPEKTTTRTLKEKSLHLGNRVCRIIQLDGQYSIGTGTLIAPGIVMTNQHVFKKAALCQAYGARFFSGTKEVITLPFTSELFLSSPSPRSLKKVDDCHLDYALISLASSYQAYPNLFRAQLIPTYFPPELEKQASLIGHPEGAEEQIYSERDNTIVKVEELIFTYISETKGGSSGSPVFNSDWELIGLHRAGTFDSRNQGIRIDVILADLEKRGGRKTLEAYLESIGATGAMNHWWRDFKGPSVLPFDSLTKSLTQDFQIRHYGSSPESKFLAQAKAYYIPLYLSKDAESPLVPFEEQMDAFLAGKNPLLLLHGGSGSGKTLSLHKLEEHLWEHYQGPEDWLPLYIDLKTVKSPQFIDEYFTRLKLPPSTSLKLVLLLDGYDEMGGAMKDRNLYREAHLGNTSYKVIVSCRSQYLNTLPDYWHYFDPSPRNLSLPKNEQQIAPLKEGQKRTYLRQYAEKEKQDVTLYENAFEAFPSLSELIETPLLLRLLATTLPDLKLSAHHPLKKIELYDAFVKKWFEREYKRLEECGKRLQNPERAFGRFCEKLAYQMFLLDELEPQGEGYSPEEVDEFAPQEIATPWSDYLSANEEVTEKRIASPLLHVGGSRWRFIHKSFYEYFCACRLYDTLLMLNETPHQEEAHTATLLKTLSDRPLNQKRVGDIPLLHAEPEILNFLAEKIRPYPAHCQRLLQIVLASKNNPQLAITSANALTLLNWMQFPFSGLDLSQIEAPYAWLYRALFHHTNLSGANLEGATLIRAQLVKANLTGANLLGTKLGQWPMLRTNNSVDSVAFHPDKDWVALGGSSGMIEIWDWIKVKRLFVLKGHEDRVESVAFSLDGKQIASGSWDKTVRLWSVCDQSPIGAPLVGHKSLVFSVAFSPDGKLIASGSFDETVRLWSVCDQSPIGEPLVGHKSFVKSVAFSPDGKQIASGSHDKTVRLWSVCDQSPIGAPLAGHKSLVFSVAFSPDSKQIASGSYDKTVRLWSVCDQSPIGAPLVGHKETVASVAFSPDGKQIASGSEDFTVRLWSVCDQSPIGEPLVGHKDWVFSVAFSPDGKQIASGSFDETVRLWSVCDQSPIGEPLVGHKDWVYSVAFSPDGKQIASGSSDFTVRLWSVCDQSPIGEPLVRHKETVASVAFSPDGDLLASGSHDKTVRLWSVCDQSPIGAPLVGHEKPVLSVAFSPDGKLIASGSRDFTVRLWSVCDQSPIGEPLVGHKNEVLSVVFSPDGKQIASGSFDETVRLWSVKTRTCLDTITGHNGKVSSVLWPLESTLITGSYDHTIAIWKLFPTSKGNAEWSLIWQSEGNTDLIATNAILKEAKLSPQNLMLLEQKGGIVDECN